VGSVRLLRGDETLETYLKKTANPAQPVRVADRLFPPLSGDYVPCHMLRICIWKNLGLPPRRIMSLKASRRR
jgi:hypothetical protein